MMIHRIRNIFIIVMFILLSLPGIAQEIPLPVAEDTSTTSPESEVERIKREILELYPTVDFGREVDEPKKPRWLFEEEDDVRQLLGLNPRFIYNPKNLRDPMVIPWIRQNVIAQELFNDVRKLVQQERYDEAMQLLTKIIDSYPGTSVYSQAQKELQKLKNILSKQITAQQQKAGQKRVILPTWVYENTKGVIWDPQRPVVLVGEYTLGVGEAIPKYPSITVERIQKKLVVFKYKEKLFQVTVEAL